MTNSSISDRARALATFCDIEPEDVKADDYAPHCFKAAGHDWLVLTEEEADNATGEYIQESVWAFNADFIADHANLPREAVDMIKGFQEAKSESANEVIASLIERGDGMKAFIEDAISADGRGHFLATYDGNENEEGDFLLYRV